ncbi:Uncharacterised protein [uncultured archaeon]|nr:Uncharacterised protein [uncultured archaeon]
MNLVKKLAEAGKQTKEDKIEVSRAFSKMAEGKDYYGRKDLINQKNITFLRLPLQYFSRLFGKDYWKIGRSYHPSQFI